VLSLNLLFFTIVSDTGPQTENSGPRNYDRSPEKLWGSIVRRGTLHWPRFLAGPTYTRSLRSGDNRHARVARLGRPKLAITIVRMLYGQPGDFTLTKNDCPTNPPKSFQTQSGSYPISPPSISRFPRCKSDYLQSNPGPARVRNYEFPIQAFRRFALPRCRSPSGQEGQNNVGC
jgi:hypothetical protein